MKQTTTMSAYCDLPFTKLILNGWGDVSMCCYQLEQLGNILDDTTVMDLWNSEKAKQIRAETLEGKMHRVCKSWNTCPFLVQDKTPREFEVHEDCEYPTYIEICLPNTHCNIGGEEPSDKNPACIMCCRNYDLKPQPKITDILCEKAKPLVQYLRRLCILGVSEPFWKDAIFDVMDKIDFHQYRDQIRVETNTNVSCLYPKVADRWFDTVRKSEVSFSMDAATPETYQKIRRIDGFEHMVDYLHYYCKKRDQSDGEHRAVVYNNINVINVHEMTQMVEMAYDCEVDQITMIPTHDQCGRVAMDELLLNARNVKIFKKNAEAAKKRSEELGIYLHFPKPFDKVAPPVGQEFMQEPPEVVQIKFDSLS